LARKKKQTKGPLEPRITAPSDSANDKVKAKRQDEYKRWVSKVHHSQKVRKDWERDYIVEECEKFIIGKQVGIRSKDPVFNHTLATIKTIKPSIFYTHPKFYIRPKPGNEGIPKESTAAIGEAVLDSIGQQDNNFKNAASLALWQNFTRIGVLKIIHEPTAIKNPDAGQPMWSTQENGDPIIDPQTGLPSPLNDPATGQPMVEPDEVLTDQVYRYEWIEAGNMLLPDEGPDQSKWTWIGEEIVVTLDEAKEDERFPKALRDQLDANETTNKMKKSKGQSYSAVDDKESERLRYYECYDIDERKWYVIAEGQQFDDFLLYEDLPKGIEDHPYAILPGFTPIMAPEPSPWPLPHVFSWMDIQKEYNIRRKQITEGAKRSSRKGVFEANTFEDEAKAVQLLQSPDDMTFTQVSGVATIKMLEAPDVNPSIYKDVALLQADWRIITGQTGARLSDPDTNTATEATYVERAGNLRDADMLDAVNDWLTAAGKKMFRLVKATMTLDMWIHIRGFSDTEFKSYVQRVYQLPSEMIEYLPGLKEIFRERYGKEKWHRATRQDLEFEADVSVVPGSYRPRNLDIERKQWMEFLSIIGQFPQLALSRELLRETAAKFEYISERMLDELTALAQKMIQVNANQAGRGQGGNGEGGATGNPLQAMMAGMGNAG